ncbi:hypothetical protein [Aliivibrio wodanis]|uniref:hypothetical protein n=1 Tax=Aliivibrio wodanis TaxID=80852 RepID=UPI00406C7F5B
MDKLSKAAQNLKMPVEELQAMQSQAEHAGDSSDTMTSAMIRFTKRLGVLQTTGKGAMGSFLKKGRNPLYRDLKNAKDTEQAYGQLLDSFSKLKTNQSKWRSRMQPLGKMVAECSSCYVKERKA